MSVYDGQSRLCYLKKGAEIWEVFFDFKKAFDSIPHSPLLSKLEAIGLDPHIITWIHNYLAKRQQLVVFNGVSSVPSSVVSGVYTTRINPMPTVVFDLH